MRATCRLLRKATDLAIAGVYVSFDRKEELVDTLRMPKEDFGGNRRGQHAFVLKTVLSFPNSCELSLHCSSSSTKALPDAMTKVLTSASALKRLEFSGKVAGERWQLPKFPSSTTLE